jgi:hypothetical protein
MKSVLHQSEHVITDPRRGGCRRPQMVPGMSKQQREVLAEHASKQLADSKHTSPTTESYKVYKTNFAPLGPVLSCAAVTAGGRRWYQG